MAALLSKSVVASAPAVLLVVYWWKRGRVGRRDVMPLMPFFAVGMAAGLHTAWLEKYDVGAEGVEWAFSPIDRVLIAGRAAWFYASKLVWPQPQMFFYPRWVIDSHAAWQYLFPLAALLLLGVYGWPKAHRSRAARGGTDLWRRVGAGARFLQRLSVPFFVRRDHFQYHASIAILTLFAAGVALLLHKLPGDSQRTIRVVAAAMLLVLAVVTCRRTSVFRNPEVLYRDTIAKNPGCAIAYSNLALPGRSGTHRRGPAAFARGGALGPNEETTQNILGLLLLRSGREHGISGRATRRGRRTFAGKYQDQP